MMNWKFGSTLMISFVITSFTIVVMFFSCSDFSEERDYVDTWIEPTNQSEVIFIDTLESMGFSEVEYSIPIPKKGPFGEREYKVSMRSSEDVSEMTIDSISLLKYEIADVLYSTVISDSILIEINEVQIDIQFQNIRKLRITDSRYYDDIKKSELEKRNGFKVVKKNNRFRRIPVK